MKIDNIDIDFKNEEEQILAQICYDMVMVIRKHLANSYDDAELTNYEGLCDLSIKMLAKACDVYSETNSITLICQGIHGEQCHNSRVKSEFWPCQHTWAVVRVKGNKTKMYVDPTSGQFKNFHEDIPDFYISPKKPKWYYPDSENPIWCNKIIHKINEKIQIPRDIHVDDIVINGKEGIIEYLQYGIWGRISDWIYKLKH